MFKKNKKNVTVSTSTPSTQGWIPVKDIYSGLLETKDKRKVGIVKMESVNTSLLTEKEAKRFINSLSEVWNGIDYSYSAMSISKPVDLDGFISGLEAKKTTEEDFIRRKILEEDIRDASMMASEGEALDRHYYFLHSIDSKEADADLVLSKRSTEIANDFNSIGLRSTVCTDQEIRDLLFIFFNPVQAAFERGPKEGPYFPVMYKED